MNLKQQELQFSRYEEAGGEIGIITFNRPEARNALTFAMYQRLADVCASPPDGVKALIVSGAGDKAFAAGTDISQFRDFTTPQHALDYEAQMEDVLTKVESCPVPTIAAINGACTGGGAIIAAACDIRLCANGMKFGFPIARTLGNCLSANNLSRLTALIGAGRVREIIFTCRLITSTEALQVGLVSEVLEDNVTLNKRALELATTISGHAPLTLRATKTLQQRLAQNQVDDHDWIIKCYTSADFRQGLEAFLNKRRPHWQGE